jgi:hypothetical protein
MELRPADPNDAFVRDLGVHSPGFFPNRRSAFEIARGNETCRRIRRSADAGRNLLSISAFGLLRVYANRPPQIAKVSSAWGVATIIKIAAKDW